MTNEKLIEILQKYPKHLEVSVYVENIDSAFEVDKVEGYNGEIQLRIDY